MAFAMMGTGDRAWELFGMLNPIHHADSRRDRALQGGALRDVRRRLRRAPHTGRGGWTWYTGAAGWMYRLAVETLLGLRLEVDRLRLEPRVPKDWGSYKIHYRYRETVYHITIERMERQDGAPADDADSGPGEVVRRVTMDGADIDQTGSLRGAIPLADDRRDHNVQVVLA